MGAPACSDTRRDRTGHERDQSALRVLIDLTGDIASSVAFVRHGDLAARSRHGIVRGMCRTEHLCELALAAQQGDMSAMGELYRLLSPAFTKHARSRMYDAVAAADAVTDSLFRAVDKFDPDRGHFESWAALKLRSAVIDWYRAEERRRRRESLRAPDELPESEAPPPTPLRSAWELCWPWLEPRVLREIEARSSDVQTKRRTAALAWIDRRQRGSEETFADLARELDIDNGQASRAVRWVWQRAVIELKRGENP